MSEPPRPTPKRVALTNRLPALGSFPRIRRLAGKVLRFMQRRPPTVSDELRRLLAGRQRVFFVQVGSNDGLQGDPIFALATSRQEWRGILVEPVPFLFERLRANYRDDPRFVYANVAIGETPGRVPFYYVGERAREELVDLPYWHDQVGSFDRSFITRCLEGRLTPYIVEELVECVRLESLLEQHGIEQLDLVHIDAEGYDYVVLAQLDLKRYRPLVIVYEHQNLRPEHAAAARNFLLGAGYHLYELGTDTLAVRSAGE
jgi:FkbM family methyltransferase